MILRLALVLALLAAQFARAPATELPVELWLDDEPIIQDMVQELNFSTDPITDLDGALAESPALLLATATPAHLKALRAAKDHLDAFFASGGWLMLTGLDHVGLADYDALVGVDHILRPFRSERVTVLQDRLTAGVSPADVGMRSASNPWAQDVLVADDAYGPVVDTDDVAGFLKLPGFAWFKHENNDLDHSPTNMLDGFGSADSWKRVFALYPTRSRLDWTMTFPRPTAISDIEVITSFIYPGLTQLAISLDGGPEQLLDAPQPGSHHLPVQPPRVVTTIGMRVSKTEHSRRDVVGIDDIHVTADHAGDWHERVHPLANIGVLVSYPRGSGGIVLCQLAFHQRGQEQDFLNFQRRERVLGRLLANLGARRGSAGKPLAPGNDQARGTPLPLAGAVALAGDHDLLGEPAAIAWPTAAGTDGGISVAATQPPTAVLARAGGTAAIPVGMNAIALVLLQAAQAPGSAAGDDLGHYRVVFDDGRSEIIPIEAGVDVGELRAENPGLVERAQLVLHGSGAARAALYLRQWDNPTPSVRIAAIELCCTRPHAAIALLALTALR